MDIIRAYFVALYGSIILDMALRLYSCHFKKMNTFRVWSRFILTQ